MSRELLNLDEDGEWTGEWWLPDEPYYKVPGILRYTSADGLKLTLIGLFEDCISTQISPGVEAIHEELRTWEVIHGAAEQREITLFGCLPNYSKRTYGARVQTPDKQTITSSTALIGAHISSKDEAVFSAVEVSVENLGVWGASSVLEGFMGAPGGRLDGSGTISVKPVEAQSVKVDESEFILAHHHTLPFFDRRRGRITGRVRDTTFIQVVPEAPFSWSEAIGSARLVQDLIALATHRAAGVIWLRLRLVESDAEPGATTLQDARNVEAIYSPPIVGNRDAKAIEPHRVFFTCETLPFEEIIPRWCEVHERLQPALNMILGLRYGPARYIENNLLTAVGAAEVLHRGLGIDEPPMPREKFKQMREAILAHVPEEHRERIKGSLRNDPTLRERLCALAARPDPEAMSMLLPDVDR